MKGIFSGYHTNAGGGWSGDLYVIDWESLANAKSYWEVYPRRVKHAEVMVDGIEDNKFVFPVRSGQLRQPLEDLRLGNEHSSPEVNPATGEEEDIEPDPAEDPI